MKITYGKNLYNNLEISSVVRTLRKTMLVNNRPLDPIALIKTLDKFSTTADYDKRVIRIINKVRKLEDTYASDKTIK